MNRIAPPSGRNRRSFIIAAAIALASLSGMPVDPLTTFSARAVAAAQAGEGSGDRPKGTVWVVNRDLGQLAIFDAATGDLLATRPVGRGAHDICISEQSHKAYITAEMDNAVTIVDTDTLATESIPLGSTVDATKGKVRLTSASGPGGKVQAAVFYKGAFVITQTRGAKPVTQLALSGKLSCGKRSGRKSASTSARKKRVRRLWGDGRGRFRTKGRHGAATVRGTKWLTEDRCGGTLVRVQRGVVAVRDFTKKKTVVVKKGKSYLARPKAPKRKRP